MSEFRDFAVLLVAFVDAFYVFINKFNNIEKESTLKENALE